MCTQPSVVTGRKIFKTSTFNGANVLRVPRVTVSTLLWNSTTPERVPHLSDTVCTLFICSNYTPHTYWPRIDDDVLESEAMFCNQISHHHIHCVELLWGERQTLGEKELCCVHYHGGKYQWWRLSQYTYIWALWLQYLCQTELVLLAVRSCVQYACSLSVEHITHLQWSRQSQGGSSLSQNNHLQEINCLNP